MKALYLTSNLNLIGGKERYDKNFISVLEKHAACKVIELRGSFFFWKIWFAARAWFAVWFGRPDIIWCALINFSPICLVLKRMFGTPFVLMTHGVEVWNIQKNIHKQALLEAKRIITVSNFTRTKIEKQTPSAGIKIRLIPNTVDERMFTIRNFPKQEKKIILTVSRLYAREKYKGYDKVLEALPSIKKEISNVEYMLVGRGDDERRVRDLARRLGCEANLRMPGFEPDQKLAEEYNMADVFVLPSRGEGFGVVFLEALASGVPVVAGNIDASREAILDGRLGILVNPESVEEIAGAILRVLKKKVPSRLLDGGYLRREALRAYGFDTFTKRVVELVRELEADI